MRVKIVALLLGAIFLAFTNGATPTAEAQQDSHRKIQPQSATLRSQIKHKDFAKANFNFELGVRGDSDSPPTRNVYDLRYGGVSYDRDNDWFDVPLAHGSRSQITDLGALNWADIYDIPFLSASPVPHSGLRSDSYREGKIVKSTPENTLVKVMVGHMYLLHAKDDERDLYAMFRAESLKSGDEVTISWKVVPSPEK